MSNFQELNLFFMPIKDRGFNKLIISLKKSLISIVSFTVSVFTHCYQILKDEGQVILAGLQASSKELCGMAKLHDIFLNFFRCSQSNGIDTGLGQAVNPLNPRTLFFCSIKIPLSNSPVIGY